MSASSLMGQGLRLHARRFVDLIKATVDGWSEIEGFRLGAAFSFYATFSIFPLLLLAVTFIGFLVGDDAAARDRMLGMVQSDPQVRDVLERSLSAMQQSRSVRGASALVGVLSLLFSASGALVELDSTLNKIWRVPPREGKGVVGSIRVFLIERASGFAILVGLTVTLLVSLASSSLLAYLSAAAAQGPLGIAVPGALLRAADLAMSIALLSSVFVAAFHFIPRSHPRVRDVVGGAILTTAFLTMLKEVFAIYLAHLTRYSAYGVAGGFLGLVTWIYLSSQIIFFGAQLTSSAASMTSERTSLSEAPRPAPDEAGATRMDRRQTTSPRQLAPR